MMSITDVEDRLAAEESFLDAARVVGNQVAIALAEKNIAYWSRVHWEMKLADEGGWPAPKVGDNYDLHRLR